MSRQLAALLALAFWLFSAVAMAQPTVARVTGAAEVRDRGGEVVLTVPVSEAVPWKVWLADDPPRFVVEFNDLEWEGGPDVGSSSISEVRLTRPRPGWLRMIAYLREPLTVARAEMVTGEEETAILELVLSPTTGAVFQEQSGTLEEPLAQAEPARPVVVIDPGHGGRDPGAEAGEVNEADLMLDFARLLKTVLDETGMFEVVLTRDADVFVPLNTRVSLAREVKADVFLSLHADRLALNAGNASGLTLYTLGQSRGGAASDRTVSRQRPDDLLKDVDLSESPDDVALALMALQRQDTDPRNAALSATLLSTLRTAGVDVNSRPERQADFAVLKAADIPSILIELGFLSSDEDLARLTSEDWQNAASLALRDGLMLWLQEDEVLREALRK